MSSVRVVLSTVSLLMCLLGLAVPAWAEDDPSKAAERLAQLRRDLTSDEAATVAHAAYAASEGGLSALTPDLISALATRPEPERQEDRLVIEHLLDALIRLDATVPMETLSRFEDEFRTSVLILAVRNGQDAYPLLRKTLERSVWGQRMRASGVAAGNVLSAARDKSVAPSVLGHIQPVVKITVRDHDRREGGGLQFIVGGHGDRWCTVPEGFPPMVWYELEFERDRDHWSRLLARGPVEDVWYERWVDTRKELIIGDLSDRGDTTEIAMGWVAQLLGTTVESLALKRRYYASHRWTTPNAYLAFAEEKRHEVERDADRLKAALVKARLLTEEESAAIAVEPGFELWDGRDDKSTPLPKIDGG